MRAYQTTTLGGLAHLGISGYDDDSGEWTAPEASLCGLESSNWSQTLVKAAAWANRRPGTVCPACDRTAMWQSITAATIK